MRIIVRGRIIDQEARFLGYILVRQTKPDPSLRILGERIRLARKAAGYSQEDFAFETGLDRSYMGGVERGQRNLSFLKLCAIAAALKSDLGRLLIGLPVGLQGEQDKT